MASDEVPALELAQDGTLVRLALILGPAGHAEGAARVEAAAARRGGKVGRRAADSDEALPWPRERRERFHEAARIRVERVAVQPLRRRTLDDLAGVHDRDRVRELDEER